MVILTTCARAMVLLQLNKQANYFGQAACKKWRDDAELVEIVARGSGDMCRFMGPELAENRAFIIEKLKKYGLIHWADIVRPKRLQEDRELALWAINQERSGTYLSGYMKTPDWWKRDEEIVRAVLRRYGTDLKFVSRQFRSNREIVQIAMNQNPSALQFASEHLRDDNELVLEAVRRGGVALEFASSRLRDDKDLVLEAVRKSGMALEFASSRLRADREVADTAARQSASAFHHVDERLRMEVDAIKNVARATARNSKGIKN